MGLETNSDEEKNNQLLQINEKVELQTDESNDDEDPEIDTSPKDSDPARTWFNRTFSRIGPGSVRSSIFSLSIISIGLGCLALPAKFQASGILGCLLLLAVSGIATYYSLIYLTEAGHKLRLDNYSDIVKYYYGTKASKTLDILIIVYIFGAIILYQIFSKDILLKYFSV